MYTLDERQAFEAMTRFLTAFYLRTNGDMQTLMADIEILDDGLTQVTTEQFRRSRRRGGGSLA